METNLNRSIDVAEKEIDFIDLAKKLWIQRKFLSKVSAIGLLIGIVVAISIPKEYSTTIILAPESNSSNFSNGAGALASMAGVNFGGGTDGQMSPELYPNIVSSTPFILGLFDIAISDQDNNIDTTLYVYIKDNQKTPWWTSILLIPGSIMGFFSSSNDGEIESVDSSSLTREQMGVLNNLRSLINIQVDKKTQIISLTATMQDPKISAFIADTLTTYLQSYIINYRTQKARQDLIFTEQLYREAKKDYNVAQEKYAKYLDENQNVILASFKVNQEKLYNEANLTYSVYNQMAQQLQLSKVKVQDVTPVYTVIEPAIKPLIPSKPNKKIVVVGFVFIAFVIGSLRVLAKEIF